MELKTNSGIPIATPVVDPAAWRGDNLSKNGDWIRQLTVDERNAVLALLSRAKAKQRSPGILTQDELTTDDAMADLATELLAQLEGGRGFVVLRDFPFDGLSQDDCRLIYWEFGLVLGHPERQDAAGHLIHDVRDTGTKFGETRTVRYYQTDQEITFHNDGADVFALACRTTAARGGRSKIVSAVQAFNTIAERRPDLAVVLQQDFWQDTRGQGRNGAMFQIMPVYFRHHGCLSANYKHQLIMSAQSFDEVPRLTSAQREAVDMLDAVCNEPGMALEFDLTPGDVLIANNYVTFHSRTAFDDHEKPEDKRHMLRLWLTIPNGRPLPPAFEGTREFGDTFSRRVST